MFHEFFHISEDISGHVGTARNVAGLYVVDVVEFPELCNPCARNEVLPISQEAQKQLKGR